MLGLPFYLAIPLAGLAAAVMGVGFGLPSLRIRGLYLVIATLAAQFILNFVFVHWQSVTNGDAGLTVQPATVFGYPLNNETSAYYLILFCDVIFTVFAIRLLGGHDVITAPTETGPGLAAAFVMEVTIAVSASISWASYASDYSRYLPARTSRAAVFGYTFAGLASAYIAVQAIGVAAGGMVADQSAEGVRSVMGGGVLGGMALLAIVFGAVAANAMNDYSGSLAMQTAGVKVRRPLSAALVAVIAFGLIMWLNAGNLTERFQGVLLFISYWVPAFVAIVIIDWRWRSAGRDLVDPAVEITPRADAAAAMVSFAVAFGAAVPFMHTNLITGPVAAWLHGADLAYFVNCVVAAALYGGYRVLRRRRLS